jgi:hypothetical protein
MRNKAHLASAKRKPSGDLESLSIIEDKTQAQLTGQPTKKEKALERRESFLRSEQRTVPLLPCFQLLTAFFFFLLELGSRLPALSKNHARRMKRKAKEQLAGDTLADLSQALASLEEGNHSASNAQDQGKTKVETTKKPQQTAGLIGEGRGRPLSKSQRKRMLYVPSFG